MEGASAEREAEAPPPGPGSPSFSIPALKAASRRPTVEFHPLQTWPAPLPSPGARLGAGSGGGSGAADSRRSTSESVGAQVPVPLHQRRQSAWQCAWDRVSATGAALFQAAAWALPPYASRSSLLSPRSHSLEVLSLGLEQSTPYLPTKRSMLMQRQASTAALAPLSGRALAVQRWQRACQAVADARDVLRCLDLLANRLAPAEDRLHAAFLLRMRVDAYPSPERLACKLLARRGASRMPWTTHMVNELYITGERIFSFFVPPSMGEHRPYVTLTLVSVLVLVYFFMAGQYGQYQAVVSPASTACLAAMHRNGTATAWGSGGMVRWIAPKKEAWCYSGAPGKFDAPFLIDWGARWAPDMRRSPHRWLTSTLLHQSFMHLLSNCLLLAGLGGQMEMKHGSWRAAVLAVLSALGGNLFSAVTEARCVAVVGASGIVFGAGAVVVADTIHNFETLSRPVLRTTVMLSFLIYFGASVGTTPTGTSHMSHVGGFMCGLLAALVILRNPHRGRAELACTAVGAAGCLAIFIALPCIFYLHQLPRVQC